MHDHIETDGMKLVRGIEGSWGDHLIFEPGPEGEARRVVGWIGPWPPPERFGVAKGMQSGTVSWFDPDELPPDIGIGDIEQVAVVTYYRRESHSELPPQEKTSHVARGALYKPE